jgi:transposase
LCQWQWAALGCLNAGTDAGSRARKVIEALFNEAFTGVLLSDGNKAYASYVAKTEGLVHAQCWAHTRRQFFEARDDKPAAVDACLEQITGLYKPVTGRWSYTQCLPDPQHWQ